MAMAMASRAASLGRQIVGTGALQRLQTCVSATTWRCRSLHLFASSRSTYRVAGSAACRKFYVRAADVSGPGSVDSLIAGMEAKIKEQLKAQEVIVKDAYGDGRHVSIEVVSEAFEGQSSVNRQRMVYKAIWEELQNAVHAVDQLKTKTPAEAASSKSN